MDGKWLTILSLSAIMALKAEGSCTHVETNGETFDRPLAEELAAYSYATYSAPVDTLQLWTCPICTSKLSTFVPTSVLENTQLSTSAIIGRSTGGQAQGIVIAFRGSVNIKTSKRAFWNNWKENAKFFTTKPWYLPLKPGEDSVKVHIGFNNAYLSLRASLLNSLTALVTQHPSDTIYVTGYSLGGALATLAAADVKNQYPQKVPVMYNVGAPVVGNKCFTEYYAARVNRSIRVVKGCDLVPKLRTLTLVQGPKEVEVCDDDDATCHTYKKFAGVPSSRRRRSIEVDDFDGWCESRGTSAFHSQITVFFVTAVSCLVRLSVLEVISH